MLGAVAAGVYFFPGWQRRSVFDELYRFPIDTLWIYRVEGSSSISRTELRVTSVSPGEVRLEERIYGKDGRLRKIEKKIWSEQGGFLVWAEEDAPDMPRLRVFRRGAEPGAESGARMVVRNGSYRQNRVNGLTWNRARGSAEGCEVRGNHLNGMVVMDRSDIPIRRCRIHGNDQVGVNVQVHARPQILDCDIRSNKVAGVYAGKQSEPVVRRCVIRQNGEHGVRVGPEGKAVVEDCDLRDNRSGAWLIEKGGQVSRRGNKE